MIRTIHPGAIGIFDRSFPLRTRFVYFVRLIMFSIGMNLCRNYYNILFIFCKNYYLYNFFFLNFKMKDSKVKETIKGASSSAKS